MIIKIVYYNNLMGLGKERFIERDAPKPLLLQDLNSEIDQMVTTVALTIANLDDKGRWINRTNGMIQTRDFIRNMNIFYDYLELVNEKEKR